MLGRFCILDLSRHQAAIQSDCDSCRKSAMPIFTRPPFPQKHKPSWMNFWMVCKERAVALVKTILWAFWQLFIILLSLFASQASGACSVSCDHSVWSGKTKGLVYLHETYHFLSYTASSKKKRETARTLYVSVDLYRSKPLISLVSFNLHFHCFQG